MLIVSEILIFAGFFVAWFYLDATRGPFPGRLSWVDGLAGATMTGLLLLGSLTARYGRIAVVEEGDRSKLVLGYAMTVGIGVLFLAVLAFEWSNLLAEGLRWTTVPTGQPITHWQDCTLVTPSQGWYCSGSSSTAPESETTSAPTGI